MRRLGIAALLLACADTELDVPTPNWPGTFDAMPCVATVAPKPCSTLAFARTREALDIDARLLVHEWYPDAFVQHGAGFALAGGTSVLELSRVGDPPTLVRTAQRSFPQLGGMVGVAGGDRWLHILGEEPWTLHYALLDESDAIMATVDLENEWHPGFLAAREDVGVVGYTTFTRIGETEPSMNEGLLYGIAAGTARFRRAGVAPPGAGVAYGCGFSHLDEGNVLAMLPLDGRAESAMPVEPQRGEISVLYPWPYDPHVVAILERDLNYKSAMPNESESCPITLALFRDDSSVVTTHTFPHDCVFPLASYVRVMSALAFTSFGPVLHDGSGSFQLLDVDGAPVGAPIRLTLAADYTDVMMAGSSDDAFVLLSESRAHVTQVSQTVITCGQ